MFLNELPRPHPIYGIVHSNIVDALSLESWHESAVVRIDRQNPDCWIYLWIQENEVSGVLLYSVLCVGSCPTAAQYAAGTETLQDAVAYINGEKAHSALVIDTRRAERSEWPPESLSASSILCGVRVVE